MKTKILILLSILSLPKVQAQNSFKITFTGFFQDRLEPNWVKMEFEIINKSSDTLYLSSERIKYKVSKNKKELKEEKIDYGMGQPFIRPREAQCLEKKLIKDSLAVKFVEGLTKKDSNAILNVASKYIVIFPGEVVYFMAPFQTRQFDKSCDVMVWYESIE
jgi:hypothetical protein